MNTAYSCVAVRAGGHFALTARCSNTLYSYMQVFSFKSMAAAQHNEAIISAVAASGVACRTH